MVERKKTPAEIREEFERLQREREERRLQQRTNPKVCWLSFPSRSYDLILDFFTIQTSRLKFKPKPQSAYLINMTRVRVGLFVDIPTDVVWPQAKLFFDSLYGDNTF